MEKNSNSLRSSREVRFVIIVLLLISLVLLVLFFHNVITNIKYIDVNAIHSYVSSYGLIAPLILFLLQAIQAVIPILPGSVITIAAGLMLGEFEGILISYLGALLGAVSVFYISKYFGRKFVEMMIHEKNLEGYDKIFEKNGFFLTFLLRAIPFVDFGFASYIISISSINIKDYFFGTALGLIPTVLVYSYYGSVFLSNPLLFSILGIVFLILFLLIPYFMKMISK